MQVSLCLVLRVSLNKFLSEVCAQYYVMSQYYWLITDILRLSNINIVLHDNLIVLILEVHWIRSEWL